MSHGRITAGLLLIGLAFTATPPLRAQSMAFRAARIRLNMSVRSLQQIRQEDVVRQKWDLSCGSAALSTWLTYDWNTPTPETEIIVWILHRTDPVKIQSRGGFSLLDLKRFAQAHGFAAEGYADLSLEDLKDLRSPGIVPVRVKGYDHFVVFRGVVGDRAVLADPAFGNLTVPAGRFLKIWKNGLAFIVFPRGLPRARVKTAYREEFLIPEGGTIYRATQGRSLSQPTRPLE
jgi:predicted double-glycine peptidase